MSFETAVQFVIHGGHGWKGEAGYWDDPSGGPTKWGISQKAFPMLSVADLTEEDARTLYRTHYWEPVRGDELPETLALVLFDAAVNHGVTGAILSLQRALGVKDDGVLGPKTFAAAQAQEGITLVGEMCARRAVAYGLDPKFKSNGLGWSRRLFAVHAAAMKGG